MKHIKTYEDVVEDINNFFSKYKRYIVVKTDDEYNYVIAEKTKDELIRRYNYEFGKLNYNRYKSKIIDITEDEFNDFKEIENDIIFTSDSLEECKNIIPTLFDADKYNL